MYQCLHCNETSRTDKEQFIQKEISRAITICAYFFSVVDHWEYA